VVAMSLEFRALQTLHIPTVSKLEFLRITNCALPSLIIPCFKMDGMRFQLTRIAVLMFILLDLSIGMPG
jgi:hypothetical protein